MSENTEPIQSNRWRRGQSGNPSGKPPGARHKATLAAERLLDGEAEKLTRKCVEMALGGDTVALRLCLERILPPRKERPVRLALPALASASDATAAVAAITAAVAAGAITTGEGADLNAIVAGFVKAVETSDIEARVAALEGERCQTGLRAGSNGWRRYRGTTSSRSSTASTTSRARRSSPI